MIAIARTTEDVRTDDATPIGVALLDELRSLVERAARIAREAETDDDRFFVGIVFGLDDWGDDGTVGIF